MSPSPVPQPAGFDPASETAQLAQLFFALSQALDEFRLDNWGAIAADDRAQLKDEAQALDDRAHHFTAAAIGATLQAIQGNLKNIKDTTADAKNAVARMQTVSKVIKIATAAVGLGAAIASGNIPSIGTSLGGLAQAITS